LGWDRTEATDVTKEVLRWAWRTKKISEFKHSRGKKPFPGHPEAAEGPTGCEKKVVSVILNKVKDLDLVEKTRFFATLSMTKTGVLEFGNGYLKNSRRWLGSLGMTDSRFWKMVSNFRSATKPRVGARLESNQEGSLRRFAKVPVRRGAR
jgi:hypothetical protein